MQTSAEKLLLWKRNPVAFVEEVFGATPDNWQREVLEAFPTTRRIAMKASKGPGKALFINELVPTPDGIRRWGDIQPGDFVFAEDGSPTRVIARYDQGVVPLYRVTFDDDSSVACCGEHLWKVQGATERRHGTWAILNTKQIIERGVRNKNGRWAGRQFAIPRQYAAQYPERRLWLDPYMLGVWLGDGAAQHGGYSKPYVEVEEEINRRGYETVRHAKGRVVVKDLRPELKKAGLLALRSYERSIPDSHKYASIQQRTDLLCGLMDTDGTIYKDGHMEYDTTSKQLADDVMWLVRSLGGCSWMKAAIKKAFYKDEEGNRVICKDCYRVSVVLPFNPFRIPHKAERWSDPTRCPSTSRYLTRYIDRIEPVGEGEAMCIEVEHPSKCYLATDFIVTHNSCVLAWCIWNFLATRPHPKVAATSITAPNLADGLWTELAKWQGKSAFLTEAFEWQKTRIVYKGKPETWWASARNWSKSASSEQQANTLAGLHADYLLFVLDEAGGIPDSVMAAAEAGLSTGIETKLLIAGNTTHCEGPLYRACTKEKHLWKTVEISGDPDDPNRSSRVDINWAREQINKYGADHPYVLVNVFGKFPETSFNSLLSFAEVEDAMKRSYERKDYEFAPKVLGIDVARTGTDRSVICRKQGLVVHPFKIYRNIDGNEGAGHIARITREWRQDATFIDGSGGWGFAWLDAGNMMGLEMMAIAGSGKPNNPTYFNKRAEMWWEMAQWVKEGGALPDEPDLIAELTTPTYTHKRDKILIEDKELVKARLGRSPDLADALAFCFSHPVSPQSEDGDGWRGVDDEYHQSGRSQWSGY